MVDVLMSTAMARARHARRPFWGVRHSGRSIKTRVRGILERLVFAERAGLHLFIAFGLRREEAAPWLRFLRHRESRISPHFTLFRIYRSFTLKQAGYKVLGHGRIKILGRAYMGAFIWKTSHIQVVFFLALTVQPLW